jgi:hypothetical protein
MRQPQDNAGAIMNLRQTRCLFTKLISELVLWANEQGMEVAYDQVKRTLLEANANAASGAGISTSLHLDGLAADLLLYIGGVYQPDSSAHIVLGQKWKSMHPLCRWGGDFRDAKGKAKPDGNHYSVEWQGRK